MRKNETREIFFDVPTHKYTDGFGNPYISSTTIIGRYENKFEEKAYDIATACARIGQDPTHAKYNIYKGMSRQAILDKWEHSGKIACDKGNKKHDFLEQSIKQANGYNKYGAFKFKDKELYSVTSILTNHNYGRVDLAFFTMIGLKDRYPTIFNVIAKYAKLGFYLYPEICTYNSEYLISGLIDVLLVNWKTKEFIILDWKTNIDALKWEAGYYVKNAKGGRTKEFVRTFDFLKAPLAHLEASSGNKYALQLSLYAYMTELWGFKHLTNILCHIRNVLDHEGLQTEAEIVDIHEEMPYMKDDIVRMIGNYTGTIDNKQKSQFKLNFFNI